MALKSKAELQLTRSKMMDIGTLMSSLRRKIDD